MHSHSLFLSLPPSLYTHTIVEYETILYCLWRWPPSFSFISSIFFSPLEDKEEAVSRTRLQPKSTQALNYI